MSALPCNFYGVMTAKKNSKCVFLSSFNLGPIDMLLKKREKKHDGALKVKKKKKKLNYEFVNDTQASLGFFFS